MAFCHIWANASVFKKASVVFLLFLLLLPFSTGMLEVMATAPDQGLEEKAASFLQDVIQLDLSKYNLTLNGEYTYSNHLFYDIRLANVSVFDFGVSEGDATFTFTNGTLSDCHLSMGLGGLQYLHPELDPFNRTLDIIERYYTWTNDSQVQEMANLLRKVGSEKNATEASGNLTLRISDYPFVQYGFYNTFNGVDYTGLKIFTRSGDLRFDDNRVSQKIGDTTINISREQAIDIARNYLKTYIYNGTFGNGTKVAISDLNVTGVYQITLQSSVRESHTLYPYWDVMLNVSNLPSPSLQGITVRIWANDGTVSSASPFSNLNLTPIIGTLLFLPILSALFFGLLLVILCAVVIVVVLVVVLRKDNPKHGKTVPRG